VDDLEIYADPLLEKVFYHLMQNVLRYGEHATEVTRQVQGTCPVRAWYSSLRTMGSVSLPRRST
jgi:hypothetical protein